jgi:A/G-specific adenine glycosylase
MPVEVAKKKIKYFQENILAWYYENGRKFPWRKKGLTNYQYVIAEVLLQRTKAETVSRFYITFIKDFPNWEALSSADIKAIETYLIPIGLYRQRSKRLRNLADEMVKRKGRLPKNREELETIPFMGQYIANAVEMIIFNIPKPLVDVNMARVVERFFGPRKMADIRYDPYLQELSQTLVNNEYGKEINWAILDFAALVCKARYPLCQICPLRYRCTFALSTNE